MPKRYIFLLGLTLMVMSGCAIKPQIVYEDGRLVPTVIYMERNFQTGIAVEGCVARMVKKEKEEESKDELEAAGFLRLGINEFQELEKDTLAVRGEVRTVNPNERSYTLFVKYSLDYKEERKSWPYHVYRVLYKGNSRDETVFFQRYIEEANPRINLRVIIQEGESDHIIHNDRYVIIDFETNFIRK